MVEARGETSPEAQQGDPNAPAGWYPDTERGEGLRYWDGSVWTEERSGTTPPASAAAKPLGSRTPWAVAVLGLAIAADAVYALLALSYADSIGTQLSGGGLSLREAEDAETAIGVGGLLYLIGLVAGAVGFLIWFHRAYSNVAGLTGQRLRYGTPWAGWSWFIPIFNLWRPKQIANDVWRGGDPAASGNPSWSALEVSPLVHWWWAVWLLAGFLGGVAGSLLSVDPVLSNAVVDPSQPAQVLEDERAAAIAIAVSSAALVAAGVLAVLFVRRASARQEERIAAEARRGAAGGPEPGA